VNGMAVAQSDPPPFVHARDGELTSLVLLTSDPDWMKKWNTPASDVPQLKSVRELKTGQAATLLIFFSGLVPAEGHLKALCSIAVNKPNGVTDASRDIPCYDEPSLGQRKNVLLADVRADLKVEPGDPSGLWLFQIVVQDANSPSRTVSEVGVRIVAEGKQPSAGQP
jgi:hypothetical protein